MAGDQAQTGLTGGFGHAQAALAFFDAQQRGLHVQVADQGLVLELGQQCIVEQRPPAGGRRSRRASSGLQ